MSASLRGECKCLTVALIYTLIEPFCSQNLISKLWTKQGFSSGSSPTTTPWGTALALESCPGLMLKGLTRTQAGMGGVRSLPQPMSADQ